MGGLSGRLPAVAKTFLIGLMALAGIFPLSGFFSKDAVLWGVFDSYGISLWLVGFATALLTALYCGKLYGLAFSGQSNFTEKPHLIAAAMKYPLIVLAFCAAVAGVLGLPLLTKETIFASFLAPSFTGVENIHAAVSASAHMQELILMIIAGIAVIFVIWRTAIAYSRNREAVLAYEHNYPRAAEFLLQGLKMDKLYDVILVAPFYRLTKRCSLFIDQKIIDGAVNGTGKISMVAGHFVSSLQSGYTRYYACSFICGVLIFSVIVIWLFKG